MHESDTNAEIGKTNTKHSTRRDWLFTAGVAVNVAAGVLLAILHYFCQKRLKMRKVICEFCVCPCMMRGVE